MLDLRQGYLFIYYTIQYNPPMYICYDNKVKIPNQTLSNHQAYKYYGVVMRFTYDFKWLS